MTEEEIDEKKYMIFEIFFQYRLIKISTTFSSLIISVSTTTGLSVIKL